jgi:hypothetical protein
MWDQKKSAIYWKFQKKNLNTFSEKILGSGKSEKIIKVHLIPVSASC